MTDEPSKRSMAEAGSYGQWDAGAVRRLTLRDQVYGALLDGIVNGSLMPGSPLASTAVAEKLGVSRTPVREAIERLVQDGLAVRSDAGTAHVHVPSFDDIRDFFQVREVLEGLSARLACQAIGEADLATLDQNQRDLQQLIETDSLTPADGLRLNKQFHETILHASGNRRVVDIMRTLGATLNVRLIEQVYMRADPRSTLEDHQSILDAIRASDEDDAERLARAHVQRAGQMHLTHLSVQE